MEILGPDEPLPEWAGRMIDRLLEEPAVHGADQNVVRVVAADLVATLGWTAEQAERVARRTAVGRQEIGGDAFDVAEDIQQWLHDSFLDTVWPACPDHSTHPLWLDDDLMWTCPSGGQRIARLGRLADVVSVDDGVARRNRERLDAEDRQVEQQLARLRSWRTRRGGDSRAGQ